MQVSAIPQPQHNNGAIQHGPFGGIRVRRVNASAIGALRSGVSERTRPSQRSCDAIWPKATSLSSGVLSLLAPQHVYLKSVPYF